MKVFHILSMDFHRLLLLIYLVFIGLVFTWCHRFYVLSLFVFLPFLFIFNFPLPCLPNLNSLFYMILCWYSPLSSLFNFLIYFCFGVYFILGFLQRFSLFISWFHSTVHLWFFQSWFRHRFMTSLCSLNLLTATVVKSLSDSLVCLLSVNITMGVITSGDDIQETHI